jgi:hypothetical protein
MLAEAIANPGSLPGLEALTGGAGADEGAVAEPVKKPAAQTGPKVIRVKGGRRR